MQNIRAEIVNVTYKEVAIFWNLSTDAAHKRISFIRSLLNKKKFQKLTIYQYCKAEDISTDEFYTSLENYYQALHKKAS